MYGEANAKIFVSLSLLDGEFIKTLSNFCLRCSTNMKSPFYLLLMAARMFVSTTKDTMITPNCALFYGVDNDDNGDDDYYGSETKVDDRVAALYKMCTFDALSRAEHHHCFCPRRKNKAQFVVIRVSFVHSSCH